MADFFSRPFMNHQFSAPIGLHATYCAMYIAISLVTFIWLMLDTRTASGRWFYALGALILLAAILQLAARSVCISLLLILNGLLPFWLTKGRVRRIFFGVAFSLTALAFVAVIRNENLHTRYLVQLHQDLKENVGDKDGPEPRMVRWLCAWELIRASPWIGYGTGTEVGLMKEKYAAHQLYDSYAHDLNAHNQYLSILLKTGILGEILFLGILAIGIRQAWRRKDPLLGSFLVIIVCVSFSENILDVNKGIFFFSFFFSFFLAKPGGVKPGGAKPPIFAPQYGNKNTLPLVGT
jgi:O-antigen ligase